MNNLKAILMQMTNRLVAEKGWAEATPRSTEVAPSVAHKPSTQPLLDFANFINDNPEAAALLLEFGLEWPVAQNKSVDDDDVFANETLTPRACSLDDEECTSCQ
jgi:hypothetical protein